MLNWSIVSFLLAVLIWYASKNDALRSGLVSAITGGLLLFSVSVSVFMYRVMSRLGGLGKEEKDAIEAKVESGIGSPSQGDENV